jgi:SAM-dependent methyltransferase
VIDVGCGLGDDARALGPLVAPGGEVVGLDASAALLARARARLQAEDGPVRFLAGDAQKLPFEPGVFDAARTERTLQHLADPTTAVSELVRVTRRDGVVMASEPDWGTTALSGGPRPLVRAALAAIEQQIRNAWIGRDLAGLFVDAGLTYITVRADTIVMSDFATVLALTDLPELACRMQDDGHDGADNLIARVQRDANDGRLVLAITLFTVTGRVA